ncbi:MarR family winged helix-turn-helix transcriptional regulator [Pengzhenrongella sicca]|uniref:Winged helix-turn-helix transcriptional regulator n=1 Tax=Pengzhenrongella sicca TaxID=2819238 RepID=A0A8A4ZCL3_9MICO|nr:MarR family winged helix-turn-helix transcriptional regulator [Pengzhenrongella sicca]QTE29115.1 winged helix-turn-helix transcriptional regulator [Pengzhenrongella sicca]
MSPDTRGESAPVDDAPWLTADQQRDWRALLGLLAILPPALDAQLKRDAGVNGFEYQVLAVLSEAPDRTVGLSDLAALSQGSLSRLSHAITRLERSGLVGRRSCVNQGGRRAEAWLTDTGLARLEDIAPGHAREVRRLVIDVLSPEQLTAVSDAARAITTAYAAECDGGQGLLGQSCP